MIPALISDADTDVSYEACRLIRRLSMKNLGDRTFLPNILGVLKSKSHRKVLEQASYAADALGARYEKSVILASRLEAEHNELTSFIFQQLSNIFDITKTGWGGGSGADDLLELKAAWTKFLPENKEQIEAQQKIDVESVEILSKLFPSSISFRLKDGTHWPEPEEAMCYSSPVTIRPFKR